MIGARKCIDLLLEDLNEIEYEVMHKKDYDAARYKLNSALNLRNYFWLKSRIIELHCGASFAVTVDLLRENLERGQTDSLQQYFQLIRAYGTQTKLKGGQ